MRLSEVMHMEKESFWEPSCMHPDIRNHIPLHNNIRKTLNYSSWVIYIKMIIYIIHDFESYYGH